MFPGVSWDRSLLFAEAPSLGGGTGAICGVAGGWGGTACIGGSTDSDGGPLRCPAGANCGLAACGSGLTRADGSVACDGSVVRWPKFGFCALQSATSCPSICGRGLLDTRGRTNPRIMGAMQSTNRPSPALAPPCTNPCLLARRCDFGTGSLARRSALLSIIDGWAAKTTALDCEGAFCLHDA
jgi:hypothetical protein